MTRSEALAVFGLSALPATEAELKQHYASLMQQTQQRLNGALNGAESRAVMNQLAQLRDANLLLLAELRGQSSTATGTANASNHPHRTAHHGSGPSPTPSQKHRPTPSAPNYAPPPPNASFPPNYPNYTNLPRPSRPPGKSLTDWFRVVSRFLCWPITAPWRMLRQISNWILHKRSGLSGNSPLLKRMILLLALIGLVVITGLGIVHLMSLEASVVFISFPASDVFVEDAFMVTAPHPKALAVPPGWRRIACVTSEGLVYRFRTLLLPGQHYHLNINLYSESYTFNRTHKGDVGHDAAPSP